MRAAAAPIFSEETDGNGGMPSATAEDLAEAIIDSVDAGARVINLSAALVKPSPKATWNCQTAWSRVAGRRRRGRKRDARSTPAPECSHLVAKGRRDRLSTFFTFNAEFFRERRSAQGFAIYPSAKMR